MYTIFSDIVKVIGPISIKLEEMLTILNNASEPTAFDLYITRDDVFNYHYGITSEGNPFSTLLQGDNPIVENIKTNLYLNDPILSSSTASSFFVIDHSKEVFIHSQSFLSHFSYLLSFLDNEYLSELYTRIISHHRFGNLHINFVLEEEKELSPIVKSMNNKFKILNQ